MSLSGADVISQLGLTQHPEGGWYRQTWAGDELPRASGTCIYFLLQVGEASHWHRVDAVEIWHYYAGAPLILSLADTADGPARNLTLGSDLAAGQTPQAIVSAHRWQSARATWGWGLVGCTVSPGFEFAGFELAPPGFDIPR